MSDSNKRYYWLKLQEDFFRQKEIKQLRKLAGGPVFTIIYLKMLLRSMSENGRLYFEGIEDDFASEVALDIDENVEDVRLTISFLMAKGILVQCNAAEWEILTAKEMTGSEGDSARRMRKMRSREMLLASHCDRLVTGRDTEIDIEIDKEIDIEIERDIKDDEENARARAREINPFGDTDVPSPKLNTIQVYATNNLSTLSARAMEELNSYVDDLSEEVVRHAIDNALDNGKRNWGYVKAILNNYVESDVKSVGDAKAADERFRNRSKRNGGKPEAPTRQPNSDKRDAYLDKVFARTMI